jgi:hypothetical protein
MANKPLILSHNYYDDGILYPGNLVSNQEGGDVAGSEIWHISDNLRDVTRWTRSGTNSASHVAMDSASGPVSPDMLIIDRGHNLAGKHINIEASDNAWTTLAVQIGITIPSTAGGLPSDANGCLTPDGVFWKTFTGGAHTFWRLGIDPLGIGVAPILTGLYLGQSYRFAEYYDAPGAYDYRRNVRVGKNEVSKGNVRVKREVSVWGEVDIRVQLEEVDFQALRPHVDRLLNNTHPWWFCLDDSTTEGAGLMRLFQLPGDTVYDPAMNPVTREVSLLLEEVIPSQVL